VQIRDAYPWGAGVTASELARLYQQGGCHRTKAIMGLSLIGRLEAKRRCSQSERRALYWAVDEAVAMGRGPFGSRKDRKDIEDRALKVPALLRRLLRTATRLERSAGDREAGAVTPETDTATRADLAALILLDPARGMAIQYAQAVGAGDMPVLIRQAVARLRSTLGGKGGRPAHGPGFEAVVGLATRAFDIAKVGYPAHLSIDAASPEKPAPTSQDKHNRETGPRVRFTTALLRVAFPHIALGPATIRHALARLARDRRR
jgi:hypothetical protein